jgi:hypothetical protein
MKAYIVGQKIRLRSGDKFREATVTEVTAYRTVVEPADPEPLLGNGRYSIHFNNRTGKQAGTFICLGETLGWVEQDRRPLCNDGKPWEIEEGPNRIEKGTDLCANSSSKTVLSG